MGCILILIHVSAESNGLRVVVRLLSPVFEKRVNSELLCSSFNHSPSFPFEVFIYLFIFYCIGQSMSKHAHRFRIFISKGTLCENSGAAWPCFYNVETFVPMDFACV